MKEQIIIEKLTDIKELIVGQILLQKEVLNFNEASRYLEISHSYLYKLTSTKSIPHYCPNGKKLYFNRVELDLWIQRNKVVSINEPTKKKKGESKND